MQSEMPRLKVAYCSKHLPYAVIIEKDDSSGNPPNNDILVTL